MAKGSGLGDNFYIGGFDLSGDIASLDQVSGGPAALEGTAIKQSAHARLFGLRNGTMKWTTLFEQTPVISTPGFPSTNTPVTNSNNVPVFVTITGGTLTNVLVNGVSVGTTAGTYPVPVAGTIAITYSVAPTWNWFALGSEHNALSTLPRSDVICTYAHGSAVGNVTACMVCKQLSYDGTRDNTGNLTFQVEADSNAFAIEWGELLTPGIRTDTAATVGAFRDDGAGSAFGAQAYVQLIDLVGTNVDVSITHCATSGGSYTSLMDFGSMTSAPQAARQSVSNTTTVNEFLKVVTTGTFTYAQFVVSFMRNPVAGVVF